ncbi:MAG: D-sedoheptulose 7-phosphate isomerase [Lentimonas sp.]|jgi:D-sedoheptulose 7-phosphate isomerase
MNDSYLNTLLQNYPNLATAASDIRKANQTLCTQFEAGNKLLICGNGGSGSDSDHIAGELLKGFALERPLLEHEKASLPKHIANSLQRGLPVIPLVGFPAFSSAFLNDCDPSYAFAQLVWALGKPGDVLLAISTSGNSRNVLHAVETAHAKSMKVISLTGRDGGQIAKQSDCSIIVPENETYRIQEHHLPIYHCICLTIEDYFFG